MGLEVDLQGVEIASRARGTPRVALRLLRRVRDFTEVRGDGRLTSRVASEALELLSIDALGLDEVDRMVLIQSYKNMTEVRWD